MWLATIGFHLLVQAACSTAASAPPSLLTPTNLQKNISVSPTFTWSAVAPATDCSISYTFYYKQNSAGGATCSGADLTYSSITSTALNWSTANGTDFDYDATGFWCVQAASEFGAGQYTSWRRFNVRKSSPQPPDTLSFTPDASAVSTGQRVITLTASNGEEGSTGLFYWKRADNSELLIGSTVIGNEPNGKYSVAVDLGNLGATTGTATFNFFTRVRRATNVISDKVNYSTFLFDGSKTLAKPILNVSTTDSDSILKWAAVTDATTYHIWRRYGGQTCAAPDTCYLGTKPFKEIATVSAPTVTYDLSLDTDGAAHDSAEGLSYFVTATNSSGQSPRSDSYSTSSDVTRPGFDPGNSQENTWQVVPLTSGRDADIYLCGLKPDKTYAYEESADLQVSYRKLILPSGTALSNANCDSAFLLAGNASIPFTGLGFFDGLQNKNDDLHLDCLAAGSIGALQPTSDYCFEFKLGDRRGFATGSHGGTGHTNPDGIPPDFGGLTSVTPLDSGKGVHLTWILSPQDSALDDEVTHYEIEFTKTFDSNNAPVFTNPVVSVDEGINFVDLPKGTMDPLDTGTNYCFRATAVGSNTRGPALDVTPVLCASTLDNRPKPLGFKLSQAAYDSPYRLPLNFKITDRLKADGYSVKLSALEYRLSNSGDWTSINLRDVVGTDLDHLFVSLNASDAINNIVYFNTLPYFSGEKSYFEIRMQLQDTNNYQSAWVSLSPAPVFSGMSSQGTFANTTVGGCSLAMREGSAPSSIWGAIIMAAVVAVCFRRKVKKGLDP